jgi:dephospho-CoA kinase
MEEENNNSNSNNNNSLAFRTLNNAQILEKRRKRSKVVRIFSKDKPYYEMKQNPLMVILVGSPGVGKTTKATEFLKDILGVDYDNFYNIALDSLVEKVKPYRHATRKIYEKLKGMRGDAGLTNANYGVLSEFYLPTIMEERSNFKLPYTYQRIINKLEGKKAPPAKRSTKKKPANAAENENKAGEASMAEAVKVLKSLRSLRQQGLEIGIANDLNILYDTTLQSKTDIITRDIMPALEKNKNTKYKIVVILVSAPAENVMTRIRGRHEKMLAEENPYIRAINPALVEKLFIKDNKNGFENAKTYFESGNYEKEVPKTIYDKSDFTFIEIENPQMKLKTVEEENNNNNKNNNNGFRYF